MLCHACLHPRPLKRVFHQTAPPCPVSLPPGAGRVAAPQQPQDRRRRQARQRRECTPAPLRAAGCAHAGGLAGSTWRERPGARPGTQPERTGAAGVAACMAPGARAERGACDGRIQAGGTAVSRGSWPASLCCAGACSVQQQWGAGQQYLAAEAAGGGCSVAPALMMGQSGLSM